MEADRLRVLRDEYGDYDENARLGAVYGTATIGEFLSAINIALAALDAETEVKVRELEWIEARISDQWERFTAESILGGYEVLEWSDGGFGGTFPGVGEDIGMEFSASSIETAKAAAQADFERRIRSALVLPESRS